MKHSKPKERESQFSYCLDLQSKAMYIPQPIWYESMTDLCEDLKYFCRTCPVEVEFKILVKLKSEVL